jgi:hypothetical protein
MTKNVESMRKILSLLMSLVVSMTLWAETTNVTVERIQIQSMGSMIVYMLYDDPNMRVFVYPLLLQDGETDAELGKTYMYPGEMNMGYAYWVLSDMQTHALYTEATFVKTENAAGEIRIEATATDTNGDSFELVYDEAEPVQGIEEVKQAKAARKVVEKGQILIIQRDRKFTIMGIPTY